MEPGSRQDLAPRTTGESAKCQQRVSGPGARRPARSGCPTEGMKAFGAATGGLGTLGLGAAAVKQTFGTKQSPEPKPPAGDQPSREQSTD